MRWYAAGTASLAEDLSQEVWLRVFRSMGRFRGESGFTTWLYGVAKNVCREALRARVREAAFRAGIGAAEETVENLPERGLGILEGLEREERITRIRSAVETLPPRHRIAVLLREWEGMSYGEMAEILEIPAGTVRSRLHNARAILARALAKETGGGERD